MARCPAPTSTPCRLSGPLAVLCASTEVPDEPSTRSGAPSPRPEACRTSWACRARRSRPRVCGRIGEALLLPRPTGPAIVSIGSGPGRVGPGEGGPGGVGPGGGTLDAAGLRDAAAAFARRRRGRHAGACHDAGRRGRPVDRRGRGPGRGRGRAARPLPLRRAEARPRRADARPRSRWSPPRERSRRASSGAPRAARITARCRGARPRPGQLPARAPDGRADGRASPSRSPPSAGLEVEVFDEDAARRAGLRRHARRQRRQRRAAAA